jgi:hypothetical protein
VQAAGTPPDPKAAKGAPAKAAPAKGKAAPPPAKGAKPGETKPEETEVKAPVYIKEQDQVQPRQISSIAKIASTQSSRVTALSVRAYYRRWSPQQSALEQHSLRRAVLRCRVAY